jgi:formylglycine-generating enzyme
MERPQQSAPPNMVWIPSGTFRMGSDKHYPEEAPAHRVTVDGFWVDRTPVMNRQFKEFVRATGHKTFAEIPPNPKNYPGALPHMLYAGSLVFTPPRHPVDLKNFGEWWSYLKDANWRRPYGPKSNINALDNHPVVLTPMHWLMPNRQAQHRSHWQRRRHFVSPCRAAPPGATPSSPACTRCAPA